MVSSQCRDPFFCKLNDIHQLIVNLTVTMSGLYIRKTVWFLLCILLNKVSSQCRDPLLYKLNDIQQLIINLTVRQEDQQANLTYCTTEIANLIGKLEKQVWLFISLGLDLRGRHLTILAKRYEGKIAKFATSGRSGL